MSDKGNEETAGRTTTRITSGSTWAWNRCRRDSGGRNWGGTNTPPPASYGKDWYGLSDNERHTTSQLCYSSRMWDSYKALLGEPPMERPGFRFTDWYALNNNIRGAAGNGFKYSPLSWNVLGLAE